MNQNLAISPEYLNEQTAISQNHLVNIMAVVRNGKLSSLVKPITTIDWEKLFQEGGWGPA